VKKLKRLQKRKRERKRKFEDSKKKKEKLTEIVQRHISWWRS
jgi:hypothetical protein